MRRFVLAASASLFLGSTSLFAVYPGATFDTPMPHLLHQATRYVDDDSFEEYQFYRDGRVLLLTYTPNYPGGQKGDYDHPKFSIEILRWKRDRSFNDAGLRPPNTPPINGIFIYAGKARYELYYDSAQKNYFMGEVRYAEVDHLEFFDRLRRYCDRLKDFQNR